MCSSVIALSRRWLTLQRLVSARGLPRRNGDVVRGPSCRIRQGSRALAEAVWESCAPNHNLLQPPCCAYEEGGVSREDSIANVERGKEEGKEGVTESPAPHIYPRGIILPVLGRLVHFSSESALRTYVRVVTLQ